MKSVELIQIGVGGVGRALIEQVVAQQNALAQRYGVLLRYRALCDSQGAVVGEAGLTSAQIAAALAAKAAGQRLHELPNGVELGWEELLPETPCLILDLSASGQTAAGLVRAVAAGHQVILANKKPLTLDAATFAALTNHGATRYEATCGAGLPVIAPLQGLLDSGDRLLRLEAALSGSLGYLCSELEQGVPFSQAVRAAAELGYLEPDPRDDLGGTDVARKALIVARTAGFAWASDLPAADPLFPPHLATVSVAEFMARLEELDGPISERFAAARARGEVLRYAAVVTPEGAEVGLRSFAASHPLAALRGPDNLFSLTTERYNRLPLVIRGPGAGYAVTAAGVFSDLVAAVR